MPCSRFLVISISLRWLFWIFWVNVFPINIFHGTMGGLGVLNGQWIGISLTKLFQNPPASHLNWARLVQSHDGLHVLHYIHKFSMPHVEESRGGIILMYDFWLKTVNNFHCKWKNTKLSKAKPVQRHTVFTEQAWSWTIVADQESLPPRPHVKCYSHPYGWQKVPKISSHHTKVMILS